MTLLLILAIVGLALAAFPLMVYVVQGSAFRPTRRRLDGAMTDPISVLIPARDEERSIGPALESVLASEGVALEVVVLDDHSADRTAEVVRAFAARDPRVRLIGSPPLPEGWCGKQHACATLAAAASHDTLTFLDADVRLTPDALHRLMRFRIESGAALVSGFPRQETRTALEKLILPLINWLIVCYLPVRSMRRTVNPSLGAGCGQWFLTGRAEYELAGGHAAVKSSLHDGVKLPRAYRRAGLATDICDATDLAACRMYTSAGAVWRGLAKNAREGLGGPVGVWVWSVLLLGGHVLPVALALIFGSAVSWEGFNRVYFPAPETERAIALNRLGLAASGLACACSMLPRLLCAARFRQSWVGALAHPLGVLLLVSIQWYATVRVWLGRPVGWKGRAHPSLTSVAGS